LEYTGIVTLDRARDAGFESNFPAHLFASRLKRKIVIFDIDGDDRFATLIFMTDRFRSVNHQSSKRLDPSTSNCS